MRRKRFTDEQIIALLKEAKAGARTTDHPVAGRRAGEPQAGLPALPEEGLAIRRRRRNWMPRITSELIPPVSRLNQRWILDFIEDHLVTGLRSRTFNAMDAYSGKSLALAAAPVVRVLYSLAEGRSLPEELVLENGPEPIGGALHNFTWRAFTVDSARRA